MVDGTVPGWIPKEGDYHFDHHRKDGADVQIDEIPSRLLNLDLSNACFVTTQLDADACVAAAFIILTNHPEFTSRSKVDDWLDKLRSIAYDCDHLQVPTSLSLYAEFAAKCVAAMKQSSKSVVERLGLPEDRKEWSSADEINYYSTAFEESTLTLVLGVLGSISFPGENGEADKYMEKIRKQVDAYIDRVSLVVLDKKVYALYDTRDIGKVDIRVWLKITEIKYDLEKLSPITLTRENHKGYESYTIGVIPQHSKHHLVDNMDLYPLLTAEEMVLDPTSSKWEGNNGWGGRKTVGGSSFNNGSNLTPIQVLEVVDKYYNSKF